MAHHLWNITLLTLLPNTGGAYVPARHRDGWANAALFLVLQVPPPSLLVTPRLALVLAQTSKTVPAVHRAVPASFAQFARELDGALRWQAFCLIAIPLARNGMLVSAILVFL